MALFSHHLSLNHLIEMCRSMRHYLGAGLTLRQVFQQQAQRGPRPIRPIAARISQDLEQGSDLEGALHKEAKAFPPLFLSLIAVGEQTGMLPEVCGDLEKYFRLQQKLWRQFTSQITWPIIQFVLAIFVIAGLLWLLEIVASINGPGNKPLDPLGFGLTGSRGAVIFLSGVFGVLVGLVGLYQLITRWLGGKTSVHRLLLRIPVLGPCLQALALSRFCLALRLTLETGMPITRALDLSLRATGNGAFSSQTEPVQEDLRRGEDLTLAITKTQMFPEDFRNILAVGEESGRLTEILAHQADHYEDEASRRLSVLAQLAGWAVWLFVAILIVVAIYRIFTTVYLGALNQFD